MLEVGQDAPNFELSDENGKVRSNKDYLGKKLLIYFYPKDFTSGCTKEACHFRDNFIKLKGKVEIVGISRDSINSHKKFKEKHALPFTLLSDVGGEVINKFGANGLVLPKRISFLISDKGRIEKIYENVNPQTHATEVINYLNS